MGKRRVDNLRSEQELRQDCERNYDAYVKEGHTGRPVVSAVEALPPAGKGYARTCYECECTGSNGYCDNYLLYAGLMDMCRRPVTNL